MEEEDRGTTTTQKDMADRGLPGENPEGRSAATNWWTAQDEHPREDPQVRKSAKTFYSQLCS